jgi:hypothetical protein
VVVIPATFIALRLAARQRGFLIVGSPGTETPPSNYAHESAVSDRSMSNNDSRGFRSLFTVLFGARVVRILQDFAGICRGKLLMFFRISPGGATHNP